MTPWWLDEGKSVSLCRALACGPSALRCVPKAALPRVQEAVRGEIAARGLYVYESDLGWKDLWAGPWIYGTRYLAFAYVYESHPFEQSAARPVPTAAQEQTLMAFLRSLPLVAKTRANVSSFLPERVGVATAPQFLKKHHNFRSRFRRRSLARTWDPRSIPPASPDW